MSHRAIVGMTRSGKTWRAKRLTRSLLRYSQIVLVWSGVSDADWPRGARYTEDADTLERWLRDPRNFGAYVFLDETSILFRETTRADHRAIWMLARAGRHNGFTGFFITQAPTDTPKALRANIAGADVFRLANEDYAQSIVKDYGIEKRWANVIIGLPALSFLEIRPMRAPVIRRLK